MEITIIGTSHIAEQSVNEIKRAMEAKPDIVTVELDFGRANALMHGGKSKLSLREIAHIGLKGYLFAIIGQYVQQKLGKVVGISPGSDMKTAMELARKHKIDVAFIDQPIRTTLRNFSKSLSWRERWNFVVDLLKGLIFPKKQIKQLGLDRFDLSKVPAKEVIKKLVGQMRKRYPNVYKSLVEDRNKYMVKKLVRLVRDHPGKKILCVVGAGHKEGMEELLLKVDIVR
jgi:pheromone shutdown-related protein TraB